LLAGASGLLHFGCRWFHRTVPRLQKDGHQT
jgi:hypothetical protein